MSTLIIIFGQTRGEATIVILSLLLVAAIIGYVTGWLYCKSVYEKSIKDLESENKELKKNNSALNTNKNNQHKTLTEKEREMDHLLLEVNALKALHSEAVHETDQMALKNKRTEQSLYSKDEALIRLAQRRHLLDYNSFGTATEAEKDDLKMISGIGPIIEERLHSLDIYTFRQISKFTKKDIDSIDDAIIYFSGRIERDEWVEQAKELVHSEEKRVAFLERIRGKRKNISYERIGIAHIDESNDLTTINGIGGWIKEKLNALDIYTFKQISNFSKDDIQIVTDAIEYFPGRIERDEWIAQARELVRIEGKKTELLMNISEKKSRIYFDRLGVAQKHHANNLTMIKGIGLWIEEKLNMLDIYTFEQISNLTPADIETITEILDISEGRIERENWIKQASELAKWKSSQKA